MFISGWLRFGPPADFFQSVLFTILGGGMSESSNSVRDIIRSFVMESAQTKGVTSVTDNESLVKNQVMDSLEFFRLVAFLEENLSVVVEDKDVLVENFESIDAIDRYVVSKLEPARQEQLV
jgi:acyl carrier protein